MNNPNNYTVVDAKGQVLHHGTDGLLVVEAHSNRPALEITQAATEQHLSLFLDYPENAKIIMASPGPLEILLERCELANPMLKCHDTLYHPFNMEQPDHKNPNHWTNFNSPHK